ncbi:MAG TPA: right-handed parallel beta-helix repeat-containing protein [Phycisphaerae bacterium]|nr:right-handed parallel beta-helix repeat-containing protein [Phycisphaerae bacterium]
MKISAHSLAIVAVVAAILGNQRIAPGAVFFVDQQAPAGGSGDTWGTAYRTLEAAFDAVIASGEGNPEIRVAEGVFTPKRRTDDAIAATATFLIPDGVQLLGGYAGVNAPNPDDRNPSIYPTILSGDLLGNDGTDFSNYPDNARVIVTAESLSIGAAIDGFHIAHGKGGLSNTNGKLTVSNCTFSRISLREVGGSGYIVINNSIGDMTIVDCRITDCGDWDAYPSIVISSAGESTIRLNRCFVGRNASGQSPGLYNWAPSVASCTNSIFANNYGYDATLVNSGTLTLANCAIVDNKSNRIVTGAPYPTGLSNRATAFVSNCIFWGNQNDSGLTEYAQLGNLSNFDGTITVSHSCIQEWSGDLGGVGNFGSDPQFVDSDVPDNELGAADADFRLRTGSPCIDAGGNLVDIDPTTPGIQPIPDRDYDRLPRYLDDPTVVDTGEGDAPIIDVGPHVGGTPYIVVSTETLNVPEEGQAQFEVRLSDPPPAPVTIAVEFIEPGIFSVANGASLDFDATNFSAPQDVVVHAAADASFIHDSAVLRLSSSAHPIQDVIVVQADSSPTPAVIFVNPNATGDENGETWGDAFVSLQKALDVAEAHAGIQQIWVASGAYRPSRKLKPYSARSITFRLRDGLALLGGFAGFETSPDQRDISGNESVLSGDVDQNDHGSWDDSSRNENAFNVVSVIDNEVAARLDGFTITAGNANKLDSQPANNRGGGVRVEAGNAVLDHCHLHGNYASIGGGLAFVSLDGSASVEVYRSVFDSNQAGDRGGAIYNYGALRIKSCEFDNNNIPRTYGYGGAIYGSGGMLIVNDSTFTGNAASTLPAEYSSLGGAISAHNSVEIVGCGFMGNLAGQAGAVFAYGDSPKVLRDCDFIGNLAEEYAGAVAMSQSHDALIENCLFLGNEVDGDGWPDAAAVYTYGSSPVIADSDFIDNRAPDTDVTYGTIEIGGTPENRARLARCLFDGNSGGDFGVGKAQYCDIDDCTFVDNYGRDIGTLTARQCRFVNCRILGNRTYTGTYYFGSGAVLLGDFSSMIGCLISGNASHRVGGVTCSGTSVAMTNCTLFGNTASDGPAGIRVTSGLPRILNTISAHDGSELSGAATVEYCCINPPAGTTGTGNISADPQFIDPDGPDDLFGTLDDDPSIAITSPCANTGGASPDPLPATDIYGNPRIVACRVDMGAWESDAFTLIDCNLNGLHDPCEIADETVADCNQNFTPDACEIAADPSIDANDNGVPDTCEMRRLYVNASALPDGDGASWESALNDLQEALQIADAHDGHVEIWVAAGFYTPGAPEDLAVSFDIPNDVAVYGGFAGFETVREQRDFVNHVTILSGDYAMDNSPLDPCCDNDPLTDCDDPLCRQKVCSVRPACCTDEWGSTCEFLARYSTVYPCDVCTVFKDDCQTVVRMIDAGPATVLDGFSITGGNPGYYQYPGGINIVGGAPQIRNCIVRDNYRLAIGVLVGSPTFEDCRIQDTRSGGPGSSLWRGVMFDEAGSVVMRRCVVENTGSFGIWARYTQNIDLDRCRVSRVVDGVSTNSTIRLTNTVITQVSGSGGHGLYLSTGADAVLANCTIADNETVGVYVYSGSSFVARNSIFWGNSTSGNEIELWQINGSYSASLTQANYDIQNCCIQGLNHFAGPGNIDADPRFVNEAEGDFRLRLTSPCGDAGIMANASIVVDEDFDGLPRPMGCDTDMGAFEIVTGEPASGDLNGDGDVSLADLDTFVNLLLSPTPLGHCVGDSDGDGALTGLDIAEFVERIVL